MKIIKIVFYKIEFIHMVLYELKYGVTLRLKINNKTEICNFVPRNVIRPHVPTL